MSLITRPNWSKAIPGLATLAINLAAPRASINALWNHPDTRIRQLIEAPLNLAIMDLYLQFAATFSVLLATVVAAVVHVATKHSDHWATKTLRFWAGLGAFGVGMTFVWLFALGGIADVDLQLYVRSNPVTTHTWYWPPSDSKLTWIRGALLIYGAGLALLELLQPKTSPTDRVVDATRPAG